MTFARYITLFPLVLVALTSAGCVERTLVIRSDPIGAPVYINGELAGLTPLDHPFATYGVHAVRVGPLRGNSDFIEHQSVEREVPVRAPWYQVIPLDFFAEVLWPGTLHDIHHVPIFTLPKATDIESGEQKAKDALERAKTYRDESLNPD